jgi:surfeit locus 1 family protein
MRRVALTLLLAVATVAFLGLGVWQVERRSWKLALIERVETRVNAPPVAAPGPPVWPAISAESDEYRRVSLTGTYRPAADTYVQAVTDLGPGFWVLTPLLTDDGFTVLVNRGFVPPARRDAADIAPPSDRVTVTGLLRISEPHGGFLRSNDPGAGRWYSRDVAAIAATQGLASVAPYFIDAAAGPDPGAWPRGGLTVIHFRNAHLVYALTWFALALLAAGGIVTAWRHRGVA